MASDTLSTRQPLPSKPAAGAKRTAAAHPLKQLGRALASLRLTVALFAMAIFIVLAGTLAQIDKDIWQVVSEYFRTALAWVELQIFFPRSMNVPGGFYFPGGWLIGFVMAINLLAAHSMRFKMQAKGGRLIAGLLVIALGAGLVTLIVLRGDTIDSAAQESILSYARLWLIFKAILGGLWLGMVYALLRLDRQQKLERWILSAVVVLMGAIVAWLYFDRSVALGDSSMRILWQLMQGALASLVLLGGCILVFRKRAGIVLIHGGIALLMLSELLVGTMAEEAQMQIQEGQTVNFVQDIRELELAVMDRSDPDEDHVVVVPDSLLLGGQRITHDALPFDIELTEFYPNSDITRVSEGAENPATAGTGLQWIAALARPGTGTDTESKVDIASAYVTVYKKGTNEALGTYLLSQFLSVQEMAETVEVDGNPYDLFLRFEREYKPYSMHLADVRFDKYIGTTTPSNYSSDVRLVDPTEKVDRDVHIWMNNPLRYSGETFYQSGYQVDPMTQKEVTVLQVVSNTGWMIPYLACMIVGTGLIAQFGTTMTRFLRRRDELEEKDAAAVQPAVPAEKQGRSIGLVQWVSWGVVVLLAGWALWQAVPPRHSGDGMNLDAFGRLPVVYEGRVKPIDTLARNSLKKVSDSETWKDAEGDRQAAVKWLLDVITDREAAMKHKVFRIYNLDVLSTLGLERRKHYRYAIDEFRDNLDKFDEQSRIARSKDASELDVYGRNILELDKKLRLYSLLRESFRGPQLRPDSIREDLQAEAERRQEFAQFVLPHAVPSDDPEKEDWQPYTHAVFDAAVSRIVGQEPNPATLKLTEIFSAYQRGNAPQFNQAVAEYGTLLGEMQPDEFEATKVRFEAYYNHFAPYFVSMVLYLAAFVLVALSWLGWTRPLSRAAFWLIAISLAIHTFTLIARVYISGRPPVTNLYSSAVFIGWAGVVFGVVIELIYRMGIGNIIASAVGFGTLIIAQFLAASGDTFTVLQAVLDTQFWLATHVVCITLGYATTFIAGALGIVYILKGVLTPSLSSSVGKDLSRMIYGSVCFALLFSFIGTVLGGLWADDSWGRFWGWDPKENGALIIVLWNALVLHARWGGIARERGLATLAVGGNIATAWSWFGVNELGTGLHSYGFTDGVTFSLFVFILSQLAIIGLGMLPPHKWKSRQPIEAEAVG
ncbi:MAG: cytochrome c biogenesis protein CcsA [Pirellulales bacterium]